MAKEVEGLIKLQIRGGAANPSPPVITSYSIHYTKLYERNIPNIIGFLGAQGDEEPTPLRPAEVNRILGKVDELTAGDEEITVPFFVGESVKVIDGPFNSFTGVIEEVNEEKKKLKVRNNFV